MNARDSQSPRHDSDLNELCSRYRDPLYDYARHRGKSHFHADDLVQGFFVSQFLKTNFLQDLNSKKGRFRAFLLKCFKNYSLNEWKRSCCLKRGGGVDHVPFDWATADEKYQSQLMVAETPGRTYDRTWVVTLREQALTKLDQEMQDEGKREQFEVLKPCLTVDGDDFNYRAAANRLNLSKKATRAAVMRLGKRYRELIREEIRKTCDPAQFKEEFSSLLNAFSD